MESSVIYLDVQRKKIRKQFFQISKGEQAMDEDKMNKQDECYGVEV